MAKKKGVTPTSTSDNSFEPYKSAQQVRQRLTWMKKKKENKNHMSVAEDCSAWGCTKSIWRKVRIVR